MSAPDLGSVGHVGSHSAAHEVGLHVQPHHRVGRGRALHSLARAATAAITAPFAVTCASSLPLCVKQRDRSEHELGREIAPDRDVANLSRSRDRDEPGRPQLAARVGLPEVWAAATKIVRAPAVAENHDAVTVAVNDARVALPRQKLYSHAAARDHAAPSAESRRSECGENCAPIRERGTDGREVTAARLARKHGGEVHGGLDQRDAPVREAKAHPVDARAFLARVVEPAVRARAVRRSCDHAHLLLRHSLSDREDTARLVAAAAGRDSQENNAANY
jgi:hypothetical protein